MKKNIAVVGCGHWGKNLVRNFYELGALYSICDPINEIALKYSSKFKVKNNSFDEILNDYNIKGVVLAVPAYLHSSMSIKAMNAGKHVFVEKPLAMNKNDAEIMISVARKNCVHLMVGHLLQYHPIFKFMKKMVVDNKIGQLSYIYSNRLSFGKVRTEEDVIWSFAPHDISMILSLTNEEPEFITTKSTSILQKNIADTATLHIDFKSSLKAHISVSWLHPYKEQKLVVIGSSAMLVFDDTKTWKEKLSLYSYKTFSEDGFVKINNSDFEYLDIIEEEPLKNECKHFIDVVEKGIRPLTNDEEGLKVLGVLSAASESQINNQTVKV